MGLSYSEIRSLTPREFFIRIEGIERQIEREKYNTALICSFIHNEIYNNNPYIKDKNKKDLLKPEEMFNLKYTGKQKPKEKTQSWQDMKEKTKSIVSLLGGKV